MAIHKIVSETNQKVKELQADGVLTKDELAVAIEINQRYVEYLDELLDSNISVSNDVVVTVDGVNIKMNPYQLAAWLAEHMQ